MLALSGFPAALAQMTRNALMCLLQFQGLSALAREQVRSVFHAALRSFSESGSRLARNQPAYSREDVAVPARSARLLREARVFIGEAESHLMACHRHQITVPQCTARLEETLRDVVAFARRLEKSRSCNDCDNAGLDRLLGDVDCAKQSVLRLLRWIENDGLCDRVLPPCGGRGSQAHFAMRETDGSLRWIGLLNWSFDGIAVKGFDHAGRKPVRLAATDIVDWQQGHWPARP